MSAHTFGECEKRLFSRENSRGFRLRGGRISPARRAHKRVDTYGFHPLVNLPFPLDSLTQTRDRRPLRNGERQSGYRSVCFATYLQFTDNLLLHMWFTLRWVRHNSAAQFVNLEITDGTCEFMCSAQFILAGAVYHNVLTTRAALLCRTLRRFNRMCSRTLSDTANRLRKTRKKKSSAVPHFEAVADLWSAPDYLIRER